MCPSSRAAAALAPVAAARLPLAWSHDSKLHIYRPADGGAEHYAVEIGAPSRARPRSVIPAASAQAG